MSATLHDLSLSPNQAPNCWQCQHFGVTHVPSLPYQCRLMGIRTRVMPAVEVLRADGRTCRGFLAKVVPNR